jgi:hypothetical protein
MHGALAMRTHAHIPSRRSVFVSHTHNNQNNNQKNHSFSRTLTVLAATLAASAFAAPHALAQDSVSRNANAGNGMPGDALSPWAGGLSQRANYIVDMATFQSSWRTTFGIAPLVKSGKVNATRFNAVNGPSTISSSLRTGAAYPATSYLLWNAAGAGLSAAENNTALNTNVTVSGTASLFAIASIDFDEAPITNTASLSFVNQLLGAQVAFDPANPARLYVSRVAAAINSPSGAADRSQFGLGSIDADGNLIFRADGFGAAGPIANILVNDNYFRIRLPSRTSTLNLIDNAGGAQAAATDWVMVRNANLSAVPSAVPANLASRSILVGADFQGNILAETSPLSVTTANTHRPSTQDHRGGVNVSAAQIFPGSVSTGVMLTRSPQAIGNGRTDSISIFGLTTAGAVNGALTFTRPATIIDTCDAFSWPLSNGDFQMFDSQATFRGGSGPAAVAKDFAGRGMVAATIYNGSRVGSNNPFNAIVAARFDPANPVPTTQWTTVAWVDTNAADGKDILGDFGQDGAPNTNDPGEGDGMLDATPIGRLASLTEGSSGLVGPSLSAPAFDAAGNIYFIASVSLRKFAGSVITNEFDTALIRAVYNPATFCYQLELMLEPGMTFVGSNANRTYRLAWLGLADNDSIASASLWSGSVSAQAWNNANTQSLPNTAPQHLGGLVLSARIVYDVDQNAQFSDPTAPFSDANSTDEAYNVLLYVGNTTPLGSACDSIDFNNDGLFPDTQDIDDFLSVFGGGPCSNDPNCNDIDFNNDGLFPDTLDIDSLLSVFGGGDCL